MDKKYAALLDRLDEAYYPTDFDQMRLQRDASAAIRELIAALTAYEDACTPEAVDSLMAVRDNLLAENESLLKMLLNLLDYCDISDECQYGTISTSFIRQLVQPFIPFTGLERREDVNIQKVEK